VAFCAACLVSLQGQAVCGPCKNHRVRGLLQRGRISALAIIAVCVAPITGIFGCCLTSMGFSFQAAGMIAGFGLLGLVPQVIALALGGFALYTIETNPRVSGRGLAIASLVLVLVGLMPTLVLMALGPRIMEQ